jgi:hypothetical protein
MVAFTMTNTLPTKNSLTLARTLSTWLDARYLDPLFGLIAPGVGDLVTAGFGLYLVVLAIRLRLPAVVITRMILNLGVDALLGSFPILGDLFDVAFKANAKNLVLLEARYETGRYSAKDLLLVVGALLLLFAALILPVWGAFRLFQWIF